MIQLKPITESMTEQELRQALQLNFALILDAYTKGLNSIVFKGSTGATGIAGSRGASILVTNKNCLDAAQSKSGTQVDITSAYNSGNSATLAAAVTTMLTTGDADAVIEAMFNGLSFIKSTEDIIEYDICIVDNGLGFQFRYVDETWRVVPLDLELLTQFNINEMVTTIARQAVSEVLPGIQQVQYHTRTLGQGSVTGYLIPGGATTEEGEEKNPTDLPVSTIADPSSYGPFMFATLGIGPNASAGSTIFVGTTEECSKVFRRINDAADAHGQLSARKLAGMPVNTGDAPGTMARLLIPTIRNAGAKEPAYGLVFIDQQVNEFADNASGIESLWSICTAGIRFVDGKLQFHVQRNFNNMSGANPDNRGMFVMSRKSFELWCKEGVTVHTDSGDIELTAGQVKAKNFQFNRNDMKDVGTLGTDSEGRIVKASGATADPMPVGSIIMWPSMTMPGGQANNWHICDGTYLDKNTYPNLFAVIGYTYGQSGTLFRLPNFKGVFPLGAGGNSDTVNIGKTAQGVQQTQSIKLGATARGFTELSIGIHNLPAHAHSFAQHSHAMPHTHSITDHKHAVTTSGTSGFTITVASGGAHTHELNGTNAKAVQGNTAGTGGGHQHRIDTYTGTDNTSGAYSNSYSSKSKDGSAEIGKFDVVKMNGSPSGYIYLNRYWSTYLHGGASSDTWGGTLQIFVSSHQHRILGTTLNTSGYNGAHYHTLTGNTMTCTSHTHTISGYTGKAVSNAGAASVNTGGTSVANTGNSTTTPNSGSTGLGYAIGCIPPFTTVNFIIKVKG